MGEVIFLAGVPAVAGPRHQRTQAGAFFRQISFFPADWGRCRDPPAGAATRAPAQAPLRRVDTVITDLHRRTHRLLTSKLKHRPLPLHSIAPRHALRTARDLPIPVPRFTASTFIIGASTPSGGQIFSPVKTVVRIECRFDFAQLAVKFFAKECRTVLWRQPLPCSPQQAAVFGGQRHDSSEICFPSALLAADRNIQRRTHVQNAGVCGQTYRKLRPWLSRQRTKLDDI